MFDLRFRRQQTFRAALEALESRHLLSVTSPWQQADIGNTGLPGDATSSQITRNNPSLTLSGSGAGVTGSADAFHFVYQNMWGNGSIIAQIDSQAGLTNAAAEVGVMMREGLLPGDRMVMVALPLTGSAIFSHRLISDDVDASALAPVTQSGQWLKLTRSGNAFGVYVAARRGSWHKLETIKIPMTVNIEAGLFVSSADVTQIQTANADSVLVTSQKPTANPANWRSLAAAPLALYESSSATVNGKLYVFGGFFDEQTEATAQSDVYDPASNTWTRIADMPFVVTHCGVAVVGTDVYFAGGFLGNWMGPALTDQTNQVIVYHTLTDTWSSIAPLPDSRAAGGLVLVGTQLHFFGGTSQFVQSDQGEQWVYDLANADLGWVTRAPMPDPRDHFGYTTLNGLIYAIGGTHLTDEVAGNDSEVDRYDPATNIWSQLAPLPVPFSHVHTNTLVINNQIYTFGGSADGTTDATILSTIDVYNPKNKRWKTLHVQLPEPRSAMVARVVGNQIIATGGDNEFLPKQSTWALSVTALNH